MSRPRLIESEKFLGCRDQDSSRLGNLLDVKTETSQNWTKDVDIETPSILPLISALVEIIIIFKCMNILTASVPFDCFIQNLVFRTIIVKLGQICVIWRQLKLWTRIGKI